MKKHLLIVGIVGLALAAAILIEKKAMTENAEEWTLPENKIQTVNPCPADEASLEKGKEVYTKECLSCHGLTGRGDGPGTKDLDKPVSSLTDSKVARETDGALFWKTTLGRRPMPAYKKLLTEEERWDVVNYIRSLEKNET